MKLDVTIHDKQEECPYCEDGAVMNEYLTGTDPNNPERGESWSKCSACDGTGMINRG